MVMGVEAVRNCEEADISALSIDMDSGMLDSLFVSLIGLTKIFLGLVGS